MRARTLVKPALVVALASPATALASETSSEEDADRGYKTVRVPYEHPELWLSALTASPPSRVIYLDGCWDGGCDIDVGTDDSGNRIEDAREGFSSIIDEPVVIPSFTHGEESFEEIAACVRRIFGPFDVEITTEDPGDDPHWRHLMGGYPSDAGFDANVMGVSPYDFEGCRAIPNAISYSFTELVGDDVTTLCELAAHELGHSLGLDHALECRDPMTYLSACGPKSFQDEALECGESSPRSCYCGESQNSHEILMTKFGERAGPGVELEVFAPAEGAQVDADYALELEVTSEFPDRVEVTLNSQYREVLEGSSPTFVPPADISDGVHLYELVAVDQYDRRAEQTFSVTQGAPCSGSSDCGDAEECVEGRCVPGASVDGGLGAECAADDDCLADRCSIDPDQELDDSPAGVCVEPCGLGGADGECPSGFSCIHEPGAGDEGAGGRVCYAERGGFCSVAPGGSTGAAPVVWLVPLLFWLAMRAGSSRRGARGRA